MSEIVCDSCGERVVAGTQFCTSCGYFLGWNESEPQADTDDAPSPVRRLRPASAQPAESRTDAAVAGPAGQGGNPPTAVLDDTDAAARPKARVRAPAGTPCRQCATPNPPGRRFCSKCGFFIGEPTDGDQLRAFKPPPRPWWKRWFRPEPGSDRAARVTYRRSLPWWMRLRRVLIAIVIVALGIGYLRFVGRDPISWFNNVIRDWRGSLATVNGVTSASVTPSAAVQGFPARDATDKNSTTAWATVFNGPNSAPSGQCSSTPTAAALLVTAPHQITLRAVMVQTGLTTPDRSQQWVPTALDLTFSDGSCQRINVKNEPQPQVIRIHRVKTNDVRIVVVAADSPQSGSTPLAAITETALLVRPS